MPGPHYKLLLGLKYPVLALGHQLFSDGRIGISGKAALDLLTDAGSAAAHRGAEPADDQIQVLVSIVAQFIYRTSILSEENQTKAKASRHI